MTKKQKISELKEFLKTKNWGFGDIHQRLSCYFSCIDFDCDSKEGDRHTRGRYKHWKKLNKPNQIFTTVFYY